MKENNQRRGNNQNRYAITIFGSVRLNTNHLSQVPREYKAEIQTQIPSEGVRGEGQE